jgi:nucleoside-diphosphate-sugar epimerase
MKILVTGGTGFIGSHVVEHLLSENHEVRCLVRSRSALRWLSGKSVELAVGDILSERTLRTAVRDTDAVIHIAGLIKARDYREFSRVNAHGTLNLAQACIACGTRRFIFVSSQSAAGPRRNGTPLTEDQPCKPVSLYGKSKLLAEKYLNSLRESLAITIVRPCTVYGPRDTATFPIFKLVKRLGIKVNIGGDIILNAIYVTDLARGIVASLSPQAQGRTYYLVSRERYSMESIFSVIEEATGVKAISLRLPYPLLFLAASLGDLYSNLLGSTLSLNLKKLPELRGAFWVASPRRALRELGFQPEVTLERGIALTVRWYEKQGWL